MLMYWVSTRNAFKVQFCSLIAIVFSFHFHYLRVHRIVSFDHVPISFFVFLLLSSCVFLLNQNMTEKIFSPFTVELNLYKEANLAFIYRENKSNRVGCVVEDRKISSHSIKNLFLFTYMAMFNKLQKWLLIRFLLLLLLTFALMLRNNWVRVGLYVCCSSLRLLCSLCCRFVCVYAFSSFSFVS